MWPEYPKIAVLALVSLLPVLSLCEGAVPPYGSPHPDFPPVSAYFNGTPGAFDALGEAILHRASITKWAVSTRNTVAYRVFRYVDTPKVVSGTGKWLFYRPELGSRRCLASDRATLVARRLDALGELARTAGLAPTIVIAPDKAVIYADRLGAQLKRDYPCKAGDARAVREALAAEAPEVLDHAPGLLATRQAHPERALYFRTDTHWTPYGSSLALRELRQRLMPDAAPLPSPHTLTALSEKPTDLGTGMLLLDEAERYAPLDEAREDVLFGSRTDDQPTLLVHDSFYKPLGRPLQQMLHALTLVHQDYVDEQPGALAGKTRLIVSTVERSLVQRTLDTTMSPQGALYRALLELNAKRAAACIYPEPAATGADATVVGSQDVRADAERYAPTGPDPSLTVRIAGSEPAKEPCIELRLHADLDSSVDIYLPLTVGGRLRFRAGRTFVIPVPAGEHTLSVVLPRYTDGRGVRVDLGGDAASGQPVLTGLRVGARPSELHAP